MLQWAITVTVGLGIWTLTRWTSRCKLDKLQDQVLHEQSLRHAERRGRTAAEKELRVLQLQLPSGAPDAASTFRFKPIGVAHSCFTLRCGTPRQPLLVPAARCRVALARGLPVGLLEGLQLYSHCWVIYVFHQNTDLGKCQSQHQADNWPHVKSSVRVPRLNGGRMGVLATRSPHRPNPIGLSTAQVLAIGPDSVLLGGADIVDGSPVLDIKPYVPFCDSLTTAAAPAWVQVTD